MKRLLNTARVALVGGDCLEMLRGMRDNTVDALITDPPAGIGFMGKEWDQDKGGRDAWVAWLRGIMIECLRVLKPGGHALTWALPRTSHWTATAIEDAGFEIRDVVMHLFGTGFPKSLNVGNGRGTALKPAAEHWILARKPLDGTVLANVTTHGTGALNVDACRIGDEVRYNPPAGNKADTGGSYMMAVHGMPQDASGRPPFGRWPAHVVLSHLPECVETGTAKDTRPCHDPIADAAAKARADGSGWAMAGVPTTTTTTTYACAPGCPALALDEQAGERKSGGPGTAHGTDLGAMNDDSWQPRDRALVVHPDKGGASRFFYVAKPSKAETEAGLEHLEPRSGGELTDREDGSDGLNSPRAGAGRGGGRRNFHPTKKPIALMRYLIRLITPPGGLVLDPFAGSGTTLIAAVQEGYRALGCELTEDYWPILIGRVEHALKGA